MSEPFLGEIRMFAGNFPPKDWRFCDGSILSISQNSALFSLLGINYGGDGKTTFAVPDLRGRVPICWGQGPGLTQRVVGDVGGTPSVTLVNTEMASHTHAPFAFSGAGSVQSPQNAYWSTSSTRDKQFSAPPPTGTMATTALDPAGGSQPHANVQPTLAVSFIIAMSGIFPSRP